MARLISSSDLLMMPPLHIAVRNQNIDRVNELLADPNYDADVSHSGIRAIDFAIEEANVAVLQRLIDHGVDIHYEVSEYGTPLFQAIRTKSPQVVEILLNAGAAIVDSRFVQESALHHALSTQAPLETFVLLHQRGANLDALSSEGETCFSYACRFGRSDVIHYLSDELGPDRVKEETDVFNAVTREGDADTLSVLLNLGFDANRVGISGLTPLMNAAAHNQVEALQVLLSHGAQDQATDGQGQTALDHAKLNDSLRTAAVLIRLLGKVDQEPELLRRAYELDDPIAIQLLMDAGLHLATLSDDQTHPVFGLIEDGREDLIATMISDDMDIEVLHENGNTPLFDAVWYRNLPIVQLLTKAGANVNYQRGDGTSILMLACNRGATDIVRYLLDHNADVTLVDNRGFGSIHMALHPQNNAAIVNALFEHGADINLLSMTHQMTPLHLAVFLRRGEDVQRLLNLGANPSAWSKQASSPLILAVERQDIDMVRALLEAGANPYHRRTDGHNALSIVALQQGVTKGEDGMVDAAKSAYSVLAENPLFELLSERTNPIRIFFGGILTPLIQLIRNRFNN